MSEGNEKKRKKKKKKKKITMGFPRVEHTLQWVATVRCN
jgi:hypothetical protein